MRFVWDGETLRFTHTTTPRKFRQLQANIVMVGLTRFEDIKNNLGIALTVLARRLYHLVDTGLLERRRDSERPSDEYVPTEAARDFEPELRALSKWGLKWTTRPSAELSS